jgi:hypothetical protein
MEVRAERQAAIAQRFSEFADTVHSLIDYHARGIMKLMPV